MMLASMSASANSTAGTGPTYRSSPAATPPASPKLPNSGLPAKVAAQKLNDGGDDKAFYEAKLATARYYMDRYLPDAGALRRKLEAGSDSLMALGEEAFATAA